MNAHPNAATALAFDALRDKARRVDTEDGGCADAFRMLARDYRAWLDGSWTTTPERAGEVLAEHVMVATHRANDLNMPYLADSLRGVLEAAAMMDGETEREGTP